MDQKNINKHDEGICAFEGNLIENKKNEEVIEHYDKCLQIIIEHKSVSQKETATLLECLLLIINNLFNNSLTCNHNQMFINNKIIGSYHIHNKFRNGLIHLALFNTTIENSHSLYTSISELDFLAKPLGLNIIQTYSNHMSNIKETLTKK